MSRDGEPRVSEDSAAEPESVPEPPAEPARASRQGVLDALAGLAARLDREHERAAHREAVIDRLHAENQRLRRGELEAMLEPVRAALYRLHDRTRRESRRLAAPGPADPPDPPDRHRTALLLAAVADDVADALARLGVERFTVEPGQPYDASRHRPVAVTPVDDPLRADTVTAVESDGFERGGKVLRKAEVGVGRLSADAARRTGGDAEEDAAAEHAANGSGPARRGTGGGETTTNTDG
ncbi:nucleotide exchange factor GrpE [Actinomadura chibensis]|uniref:nucleotide exchange factor GrpE n=1 Tax=Actinomadura chibensis TaxID=392828 RepID=UPI001FECADB8|nr:nucleotide exchange factor GrpE [Actinomadura chibensis]